MGDTGIGGGELTGLLTLAGLLGAGAKYLLDHVLARTKIHGDQLAQAMAAADVRRASELGQIFEQWKAINERLQLEVKEGRVELVECVASRQRLEVEVVVLRTEVGRLQALVKETTG